MLTDAVVLVLAGIVALLLPLSSRYRAHLTVRLVERADAHVPADQVPALENRVTRQTRGVGIGIVLAGLALLVTALARGAESWSPSGELSLALGLLFVFGAAGLAVVEILRPGVVDDGPRSARATAPTVTDYVPAAMRLTGWTLSGLGFAVLALALILGQTRWFDGGTIWRSPVPILAVGVVVVAMLSAVAVRRVLDAPQPARNEAELYWQDAVRAHTLCSLLATPALLGVLGLAVSGAVLDDAASAVAIASGQVGPTWSLWVLIIGYVLSFVVIMGLLIASVPGGWNEMRHFRDRLWDGRPANRPTASQEA